MERVRSGKAVHVPVPAPLAPVLLSRDERQQLRLAKHRAFQRHQQNAMWTRSVFVFDGVTHHLSSSSSTDDSNVNESTNDGDKRDHSERHATTDSSSEITAAATTTGAAAEQQRQECAADESRLRDQIDAKAREIAAAKQQVARVEQEQRENQARFEELIAGLKSIADSAALTSFHERVEQARVQLLPAPARELEVVKL